MKNSAPLGTIAWESEAKELSAQLDLSAVLESRLPPTVLLEPGAFQQEDLQLVLQSRLATIMM